MLVEMLGGVEIRVFASKLKLFLARPLQSLRASAVY